MSLPAGNIVYPLAREGFLKGQIDVTAGAIGVYALNATYSYSPTHQFVSDLGASVAGGPITMTSIAVTGGVVTATPMTALFPIATGGPWKALVIAQSTGSTATRRLLALIVRNADTTAINQTTASANLTYTFLSDLFYI